MVQLRGMDQATSNENGHRLLRGRTKQDNLGQKLAKVTKPNMVLILSNAPIYMKSGKSRQL